MKKVGLILAVCLLIASCTYNQKEVLGLNKVEVGQVWVWERELNNPFKEVERDTMYILDIRGDYVQYIKNGTIYSESISWMKIGSRRIK